MKFATTFAFSVMLLLAVAGCTTSPPRGISTEAASKIKRIAPISVFADTFTRQYVGVTVFGNEFEKLPIVDWGVDEIYEEQMAAAIETIHGMVAVKASYAKEDFKHVNDPTGVLWETVSDAPNWAAIGDATRAYCAANSLDAVMVAAIWRTVGVIGDWPVRGVGIFVRGPGARISVLYAFAQIGLMDCATGKPIAVRPLAATHRSSARALLRRLPVKELPEEVSRTPIPDWSVAMRDTIRDDLISLPRRAWSPTLKGLLQPDE